MATIRQPSFSPSQTVREPANNLPIDQIQPTEATDVNMAENAAIDHELEAASTVTGPDDEEGSEDAEGSPESGDEVIDSGSEGGSDGDTSDDGDDEDDDSEGLLREIDDEDASMDDSAGTGEGANDEESNGEVAEVPPPTRTVIIAMPPLVIDLQPVNAATRACSTLLYPVPLATVAEVIGYDTKAEIAWNYWHRHFVAAPPTGHGELQLPWALRIDDTVVKSKLPKYFTKGNIKHARKPCLLLRVVETWRVSQRPNAPSIPCLVAVGGGRHGTNCVLCFLLRGTCDAEGTDEEGPGIGSGPPARSSPPPERAAARKARQAVQRENQQVSLEVLRDQWLESFLELRDGVAMATDFDLVTQILDEVDGVTDEFFDAVCDHVEELEVNQPLEVATSTSTTSRVMAAPQEVVAPANTSSRPRQQTQQRSNNTNNPVRVGTRPVVAGPFRGALPAGHDTSRHRVGQQRTIPQHRVEVVPLDAVVEGEVPLADVAGGGVTAA